MEPLEQLRHDALFYGADAEFVAAVVPFVRDGVALGQAVTATVTRHNIALLRAALGADAARVSFVDRDTWYRRPATTILAWHHVLTRAAATGPTPVRVVGEVGFGSADPHQVWTRYEAALNAVFADAPAWIVCPYDTRTLPAAVLADARRTHPTVHDPVRRDSGAYLTPEVFLNTVAEPMPPVTGEPSLRMSLEGTVTAARHAIAEHMATAGLTNWAGLSDLLLASTEIVANGLTHGRGHRELRLWITDQTVVCEVTDEGTGPLDPLVGFRPPDPRIPGGRGLWLTRQLCDLVGIHTDAGGTRVRFALPLAQPHPDPE